MEGAGSLRCAHEYGGCGLQRHSLPVELVQPAPLRTSSQSVSQSAVGSAAAWLLCKVLFNNKWKLSDNEDELGQVAGHKRKRSSVNLEPVLC